MKRSTSVAAPLLASAAVAILAGCHQQQQQQVKRCVDAHDVVVDDSFCATQQQPQPNPNGGYYPSPFRYYYGGLGGYYPGSIATGGGYVPSAGISYTTSRGGFGSSFHGGDEGAGE